MRAIRLLPVLALLGLLALPAPAPASQLVDRNARGLRLEVDRQGRALLTYRANGTLRHVLAWGAINARAPTEARPQVRLRLDYSGGWGSARRDVWRTFRDRCRPYDGPPLAWLVTACKAPDGSYWAVQSWQRLLPNYGLVPSRAQAAWEVHLSHWRGPLPVLSIRVDWAYRQFDHLFGSLTYLGQPVFGFRSTAQGVPLDTYGRNVFVDTLDSAYGRGWHRENAFLLHNPTGAFCYGFYPHGSRPPGKGTRYRASVIGPGVLPDLVWEGAAPGSYDRQLDLLANDALRSLADPLCRPN